MNAPPLKKYRFFLPLIFILLLSYWRYTYILNINFQGDPFFIPIRSNYNHVITPDSITNIKSIITYWLLFFIGNLMFFSWKFSRKTAQGLAVFYLFFTFASVFFFAFHRFVVSEPVFYTGGSNIKNFLLSPIFTGVAYLLWKYGRK